jgi:hypothetical protein
MAVYSVQSARAIANVIIPRASLPPAALAAAGVILINILLLRGPPFGGLPSAAAGGDRGQKRADYLLFKQAVNLLLNSKARSSIGGIKNIISIRASMNKGLTDVLKMNFPDILPVPRPVVSFEGIPNPN